MKSLLFLFFGLSVLQAQHLNVKNIYFTDTSHSATLVHFDTVDDSNNPVNPQWLRIRYIPTASGNCIDGVSGTIAPSTYPHPGGYERSTRMQYILSGLQPNTQYKVCPEVAVSATNGQAGTASWSSTAIAGTVTTLALPAVHPALPIAPASFNPTYPDTTSYVKVYLNASCVSDGRSDAGWGGMSLQAIFDKSAQEQVSHGTVIYGDVGGSRTNCNSSYKFNYDSQGVIHFNASAFNMTDSTIDIGQAFTEGTMVRFAGQYTGLAGRSQYDYLGIPTQESPQLCTGILSGHPYYIHIPNTGTPNKFSLTCYAPFGQTGIDGHAAQTMVFNNVNPPGGTNVKMLTYPDPDNWIILRTITPDTQFAPPNTRISPEWLPKMPKIELAFSGLNFPPGFALPTNVSTFSLYTADEDGNNQRMVSKLWVKGWEITHADDLDSRTSTDPNLFVRFIGTTRQSGDIVFDQVYMHGLGAPHRLWKPVAFDGYNMAWINSYSDKMDMYQSSYDGLDLTSLTPTSFKIAAGYHAINGAHSYTQPSDITVSLTTNGLSGSGMMFTSLDGSTLNIQVPPGMTATCTGGPCSIFTAQNGAQGNSVYHSTTHGAPDTLGNRALFMVDPFFNTSSTTVGSLSLLNNVTTECDITACLQFGANPAEMGVNFKSDTNGFITGIRFYKDSRDTATTHQVTLWNGSTQLATMSTSSETSSGWQQANFVSPVAVTAGTVYTASYFTSIGGLYSDNYYTNNNIVSGHLSANASYLLNSGACDTTDTWARNYAQHVMVGQVGCFYVNSGSINYLVNANSERPYDGNVYSQSGCNCWIAGQGPGPFLFKNNFLSMTGNGMHFDEGGFGNDARNPSDLKGIPLLWRGDYSIIRNTYKTPLETMRATTPTEKYKTSHTLVLDQFNSDAYDPGLVAKSNRLFYQDRQPLEFKSGRRGKIDGNVFDGNWSSTSASDFIAFTSVNDEGLSDFDITNNTFKHGPGGIIAMSSTEGGEMQTAPTSRMRVANNLFWDFRSAYWGPGDGSVLGKGAGYIFQPVPHEDFQAIHNTIYGVDGNSPAFILDSEQRKEGIVIRDNVIKVVGNSNARWGIGTDTSGLNSGPVQCNGFGQDFSNCNFVASSITNNLLLSDSSNAAVNVYWSAVANIIPTDPTNIAAVGWLNSVAAVTLNKNEPDFRFKNDSAYISGGIHKASDGKDIGADIDALEAAQGKVRLIGTPPSGITTSGATVYFVAPDSQSCPVDYSSSDPTLIASFTRQADTGNAKGSRSVGLTGLTPGVLYYYRVNCMVEQPKGQFLTKLH